MRCKIIRICVSVSLLSAGKGNKNEWRGNRPAINAYIISDETTFQRPSFHYVECSGKRHFVCKIDFRLISWQDNCSQLRYVACFSQHTVSNKAMTTRFTNDMVRTYKETINERKHWIIYSLHVNTEGIIALWVHVISCTLLSGHVPFYVGLSTLLEKHYSPAWNTVWTK